MGAFAAVHLPVAYDPKRAPVVEEILSSYPGTRNWSIEASGVAFEMQFPGNLNGLVGALRSRGIGVGEEATVSLPVINLAPELLNGDQERFRERMLEGPEVWDVQFTRAPYITSARMEGERVEVTVVPKSESMHELYDALLTLGLVARDGEPESQPYR